jgi:hypothetical protein
LLQNERRRYLTNIEKKINALNRNVVVHLGKEEYTVVLCRMIVMVAKNRTNKENRREREREKRRQISHTYVKA